MVYIAFEGIDGSGKSTQYKLEVDRLRKKFGEEKVKEFAYSRKDNPIGNIIKKIYRQDSKHPLSVLKNLRSIQEFLYGMNARYNLQSVGRVTDSLLLSDRSIITAYASHIGILPEKYLDLIEPRLAPNLAIFLDVPPEVGNSRINNRETLFLDEEMDGMLKFYKNYQKIINGHRPSKLKNTLIEVVDGTRPIEEIRSNIVSIIDPWLERNFN